MFSGDASALALLLFRCTWRVVLPWQLLVLSASLVSGGLFVTPEKRCALFLLCLRFLSSWVSGFIISIRRRSPWPFFIQLFFLPLFFENPTIRILEL